MARAARASPGPELSAPAQCGALGGAPGLGWLRGAGGISADLSVLSWGPRKLASLARPSSLPAERLVPCLSLAACTVPPLLSFALILRCHRCHRHRHDPLPLAVIFGRLSRQQKALSLQTLPEALLDPVHSGNCKDKIRLSLRNWKACSQRLAPHPLNRSPADLVCLVDNVPEN